ncbi:hypothetical protein ACFQI7_36090 [Paenibacillus allorhizosphaerae]|uniref:hypothetical protein n=1 Tax=Paenibacillus allorhizosphaerae TaxID=2849866 RepID=UPI001C40233A|nr:hypothetical protein [Paenibacillus allorhizosphaerae]
MNFLISGSMLSSIPVPTNRYMIGEEVITRSGMLPAAIILSKPYSGLDRSIGSIVMYGYRFYRLLNILLEFVRSKPSHAQREFDCDGLGRYLRRSVLLSCGLLAGRFAVITAAASGCKQW